MKKLMRMKLINWHRFENCTIEFGDATLLSGENGAGKSTLLDAIQYVVTCTTNYFNKAAHENGKRKLTGYIRCKTGKEQKPYEREGEISAHIALEFYEESRKQYFVIGAVVDSATVGQETTVRYLIDDLRIDDAMFLNGKTPKSINEFRVSNSKIKQWCKTQNEAKKVMKARLGRIEDKFFRLIPKALAFKPINDIKDFVYSYVLDEKEVNIDVLRENVRTYQELGKTLESVKKRISKLEMIEKYHDEVENTIEKDRMYEYFLAQAELDLIIKNIANTQTEIKSEKYRMKQEKQHKEDLTKERDEKQEMETNLRVEMKQNKEYLALEEQKKKLERLNEEEQDLLAEKLELKQSINEALKQVYQILKIRDADSCIENYEKILKEIDNLKEISEAKAIVEEVIKYKKEMYGKLQLRIAEVQIYFRKKQEDKLELDKKIEKLSKKKLSYADGVDLLLKTIKEEFERIGRKPEPYVLCELLEIRDDSWRNAVEGYLNTQRFYILTEPENFDIALGIYDKLRGEGRVFGVGLINTQKMEKYDEVSNDTLASVVTSKNIYARRFVQMILGKVQMCERYDQLKAYPTSITKKCMKYQNKVASAIKPNIYEVPFIGKNAFKVQLEQAKSKQEIMIQEIKDSEKKLSDLESTLKLMETEVDIDIKYRLEIISNLNQVQKSIKVCNENIKTLSANSNFIQKQLQLEVLEGIRKDLDAQIGKSDRKYGGIEKNIEVEKSKLEGYYARQIKQQSQVSEIVAVSGEVFSIWKTEYEKQMEQKTTEQFKDNFDRRRKANITTWEKAEEKMKNVMIDYKTEHDFGAAATMTGYPEFSFIHERLRTSELLSYEEKVQNAKQAAEEEFQEQFLAKLQENMKQAQGEFKELNRALKDIDFSNERYEFIYMPSKKYRNYYEMLMDDFNAVVGESIFNGIFHENHKEVIEELFDRLALDPENDVKALDEFTDYRTYMDYDIKIIHEDKSHSYYSKVCEEKSGGETQTPFYVTVAASFVQLYSNNIGGEAIGLIMFDEAFNNMDDERIGGVLEFLKRLPLQILIAAPPDKIQYIGPAVDETLLVMTDHRVNYVEGYHHGTI